MEKKGVHYGVVFMPAGRMNRNTGLLIEYNNILILIKYIKVYTNRFKGNRFRLRYINLNCVSRLEMVMRFLCSGVYKYYGTGVFM
jgi:hypothetical protein